MMTNPILCIPEGKKKNKNIKKTNPPKEVKKNNKMNNKIIPPKSNIPNSYQVSSNYNSAILFSKKIDENVKIPVVF